MIIFSAVQLGLVNEEDFKGDRGIFIYSNREWVYKGIDSILSEFESNRIDYSQFNDHDKLMFTLTIIGACFQNRITSSEDLERKKRCLKLYKTWLTTQTMPYVMTKGTQYLKYIFGQISVLFSKENRDYTDVKGLKKLLTQSVDVMCAFESKHILGESTFFSNEKEKEEIISILIGIIIAIMFTHDRKELMIIKN